MGSGPACSLPPTRRRVWLLCLPYPPTPLSAHGSARCEMTLVPRPPATFIDTASLCHFTRQSGIHRLPPGQSTTHTEFHSCPFPDKPQTFTTSPQPGCPLRPFHTPGVSGFKARSWVFQSHVCLPSIPPGNLARSERVMFQETFREVNSRFPLIHQKKPKERAELGSPCSPVRGGAARYYTSVSIQNESPAPKLATLGPGNSLPNGKPRGMFMMYVCIPSTVT